MALAIDRAQQEQEPAARLAPGARAGYEPFGALWRRVGAGSPATALPPARVAQAYARAIVRYWELALVAGGLDANAPLVVLDFTPGDGTFAWQMIVVLDEQCARLPLALPRYRYVAVAADDAERAALEGHPYFAALAREQAFVALTRGEPLASAAVPLGRNPAVVLAHGLCSRLEHALYAVHYGSVLEGRAAIGSGGALAYEWPAANLDALPPAERALLAMYRDSLNSTPLLLPTGAIETVDDIVRASGGRCLLLLADPGIADERDLRLGALAPPARADDAPLPANHHALAAHLRAGGAQVWQQQASGDRPVLSVALRDDVQPAFVRALPCLVEYLADLYETDEPPDAGEGPSPEQCLSRLLRAHCDPSAIETMFPALQSAAWEPSATALDRWRDALARAWAQYLPRPDGRPFHRQLGWLALNLGYYGLARRAHETGLAMYGDNAVDLYYLALCLAETGRSAEAVACLHRALAIAPDDDSCRALLAELQARRLAYAQVEGFREDAAQAGELRLEPLGPHHAAGLRYQYRDPQIGRMTSLPELGAGQDARAWIEEQTAETGRLSCAVMHEDWGFVGVVSLRRAGDEAYFHFWIGLDHQGRGYGPRAARALLDMARAGGIRGVYTSVYADNARSRAALERIGFRPLAARALPPENDLIFLYSGEPDTQEHLVRRLAALCKAIESPFVFAAPADAAPHGRSCNVTDRVFPSTTGANHGRP